jgi:hypothetical protein
LKLAADFLRRLPPAPFINTAVGILDFIMGNITPLQPEKPHASKRVNRVERDSQCAQNDPTSRAPAP